MGDRHLYTGEGAAGVQGCCIRLGDSPGPRQEGGEEEEEEEGEKEEEAKDVGGGVGGEEKALF